ncbi:MAG: site-specific DNA-methyltransferase [Candidatus Latescibacteria bacterium]|nr:site-specific DNA-methyltransferase [Candidatus Latescibacterota bacterium]
MKTTIQIQAGAAGQMGFLAGESVDLVVTSPPYPMIEMWDAVFAAQDPDIAAWLERGEGQRAFEAMHRLLDEVWAELFRALKPGGLACINIGDATRTLQGEFQLWPNHSRIAAALMRLGFALLPDILWRKPTNAPSKFMGSGMLPAGAYVTYEHEYILIARKGSRRVFASAAEKERRRESAYFWEERNLWFSDLWSDLKGVSQELEAEEARRRSGAFPFELAHRLICMFSLRGDLVLDPFLGTGTTLLAAAAAGRNAVGVELDPACCQVARQGLAGAVALANNTNRARLRRHLDFVAERGRAGKPLKHFNQPHAFPVVTAQEEALWLDELRRAEEGDAGFFSLDYAGRPLQP